MSVSFKKRCGDAVQRALACSSIVSEQVDSTRGELWFLKEPTTASIALDDDAGSIPVTPIRSGRSSTRLFWIAPGFRLNLGGGATIVEHATMRLYSGGLSAREKHLVVRGEWEFRETKKAIEKGHAQPHWHFHSVEGEEPAVADPTTMAAQLSEAPPDVTETLLSDLLASLTTSSDIDDRVASTATESRRTPRSTNEQKIHFPMAARWATLPLSCRETDRTEEAIYKWFQGVICYIRQQVELVAEK